MIINFLLNNFTCYRDETCLSMQAGPERDVNRRLANFGTEARPEKVLPVAAIYGNNASGKTQLVRAIDFLRHFAIGDFSRRELPYEPCLLDAKAVKSPTRFVLQFLVGDTVYEYELNLRMGAVEVERLVYYSSRGLVTNELLLRTGDVVKVSEDWGGKAFESYSKSLRPGRTQSMLALSQELCRDSSRVAAVFDWFSNRLFVITPEMHYSGLEDFCSHGAMEKMTIQYLGKFDIGIKSFESKDVEVSVLPPDLVKELAMRVKVNHVVRVNDGRECFWVRKSPGGRLKVQKVFALHARNGFGRVPFSMSQESDGTRRMLDLIPAFSNLKQEDAENVYVVDELERSLHHSVTQTFVRDFIESRSPKGRSQLIFTTHDVMLMDQDLLRRDSMFVVDKSADGASSLTDLRQFRGLRRSTNIREKYLEGRFGGIALKTV